jgi:TrmH family RNA methyltransferase
VGRRSARRDERAFVIEGEQLLQEALRAGLAIEAVFVDAGTAPMDTGGAPVYEVAAGVVERVASTVTARPVLAVAARTDVDVTGVAGKGGFVVVAAGVADPGNLGTLLRSAEAAGAVGVVVTEGSVDVFNPKVVRASAGALFRVPVAVEVAVGELGVLGVPLVGAVASGGEPYDGCEALSEACALVLGSETHGLPPDVALDRLVTIPHAGRAESLNVAMAATVLCFEAARRRRTA